MDVPGAFSPAFWQLLMQLRASADVAVEMLDQGLAPTLPIDEQRWPGLLDELKEILGRQSAKAILAAGRDGRFLGSRYWLGVFPLRSRGHVEGLLLVAQPRTGLGPWDEAGGEMQTEQMAHALRSAIESEVDAADRSRAQQEKMQRLAASSRLAAHLHQAETEEELFDLLLQSAAVWHDLDARVYRRTLAGTYALYSRLPGGDPGAAPSEMQDTLLSAAGPPLWISSVPDLQRLGWSNPRGELLLIPVGLTDPPDWLLALAGTLDSDVEQAFAFLARLAGRVLEQFVDTQSRALQARLSAATVQGSSVPIEVESAVLRETMTAVGADAALLALSAGAGGHAVQVLASIGAAQPDPAMTPVPDEPVLSNGHLAIPFALVGGRRAVLHLRSSAEGFTSATRRLAGAAVVVLTAWLSGRVETAPVIDVRTWDPARNGESGR